MALGVALRQERPSQLAPQRLAGGKPPRLINKLVDEQLQHMFLGCDRLSKQSLQHRTLLGDLHGQRRLWARVGCVLDRDAHVCELMISAILFRVHWFTPFPLPFPLP